MFAAKVTTHIYKQTKKWKENIPLGIDGDAITGIFILLIIRVHCSQL